MVSLTIPQIIANAAAANGVPATLALEVAISESSLNPSARGSKGELGLFQLLPATAAMLGVSDPLDPAQNAQGGTAYLAQLYSRYGDWGTALAAYNWGPTNVDNYGAAAAPASTQNYVATILANAGLAPAGQGSQQVYSASLTPDSIVNGAANLVQQAVPTLTGQILALTGLGLGVYLFARDFMEWAA